MTRHARGDDSAFGEVFDAVAPRVHSYLRRHAHHPDRAEDLLQQTFLHMHRSRGTFLPGAEVLPWAFAIARRLLIDSCRSERHMPTDSIDCEDAAELLDLAAGQDAVLAGHELAERMGMAFAALPDSQRTAFMLVKREGLSFKQAAEVLGTTVPAVKLRAQRAYDALRASASVHGRGTT